MTWSRTQSAAGTGVSSGTTATATWTTANLTANSLLLCFIERSAGVFTNVPVVQSVTDTQGNKWKQSGEFVVPTQNNRGVEIWQCDRAIGGTKPTVTATLAGFPNNAINGMRVILCEYNCGSPTYEGLEDFGIGQINSTSGTITTVQGSSAHNLAVSIVGSVASAYTVPSGWSSVVTDTLFGFAVADQVDTGASSGTVSAAWTGMTGNTLGGGIVLTFKQGGVSSSTGARCEQMSYYVPVLSGAGNSTSSTSLALPVAPTQGNQLIAVITPFHDCTVTKLTDNVGNHWVPLGDMGNDTFGLIETTFWGCQNALPVAPTLTATLSAPGNAGGQCAFTILEYANLPGLVKTQGGSDLMYTATASPSVVTAGSVPVGTFMFAYINGDAGYFDGLNHTTGWRNRLSDSNGAGGLIERIAPGGSPVTAGFSYNSSQPGSLFVVGLGSDA